MSVKVQAAVWDMDLPATDKLVLLALADHAHDDGSSAYPSIDHLAKKCSMHRRTVQRTLRDLEASGRIKVQKGATSRFPTMYQILPAEGRHSATPEAAEGWPTTTPGVALDTVRGGTAPPKPSENHQRTIRGARKRAARRCPESFGLTTGRSEYAVAKGLSIAEVGTQFEMFKNHEFATPRRDWDAAWRNWVIKAIAIRDRPSRRVVGGERFVG